MLDDSFRVVNMCTNATTLPCEALHLHVILQEAIGQSSIKCQQCFGHKGHVFENNYTVARTAYLNII